MGVEWVRREPDLGADQVKAARSATIDWVRATFVGATLGGFTWAAIIGLATLDFVALSWQTRMIIVAGVVNTALLVISWLEWRFSTDARGRTRAAALWMVPFLGLAFVAAVYTIGVGFSALRSS